MLWFKSKSRTHPQKLYVPAVRFVGEQDGKPEGELKQKLIEFFQRDQSVVEAYLAKVIYEEKMPINVALCLRAKFGEDPGLAEKILRIFASMFGSHEHLDVIFLTEQQQEALDKTCQPFFTPYFPNALASNP